MFSGLMRTCEATKTTKKHIIMRSRRVAVTTIRLGSTKAGREEYVELETNSLAERALRFCCEVVQDDDELLFQMPTYGVLYQLIIDFCNAFRLGLHLTPHGLRAGAATDLKSQGFTIAQIKDRGRWEFEKTCKIYIATVWTRLEFVLQAETKVQDHGISQFRNMIYPVF